MSKHNMEKNQMLKEQKKKSNFKAPASRAKKDGKTLKMIKNYRKDSYTTSRASSQNRNIAVNF